MTWYQFISTTLLALAAGVCGVMFAAYLEGFARGLWFRLFPKPIRGVFYTQEFGIDDGFHTKTVRRYVDGKLSARRIDTDGVSKRIHFGPGTPISDAEFKLDHGDHKQVAKQLRLREA